MSNEELIKYLKEAIISLEQDIENDLDDEQDINLDQNGLIAKAEFIANCQGMIDGYKNILGKLGA